MRVDGKDPRAWLLDEIAGRLGDPAIDPRVAEGRVRLIFCITPGRSGSAWLAELLGTCVGVEAHHEAAPTMSGPPLHQALNLPLESSRQARRAKAHAINRRLKALPDGGAYAETNHLFIKCFHDVVLEAFGPGAVTVIHLERALPRVLRSALELGWFSDRNPVWRDWMYTLAAPNALVPRLPDFSHHDAADLCIGYLLDIRARAEAFKRAHPEVPVLDVDLDTLSTPEAVGALLAAARLTPTEATWALVGRPLNTRTSRKRAVAHPVDLATCEARVADYLHRCAQAGIPLPPV